MNLQQSIPTNRRLWIILSAVAFVAFGFVSVMGEGVEGKVGPTSFWGVVIRGSHWWGWNLPLYILFYAVIVAVPAVIFGWVTQAVVGVKRTTTLEGQPNPSEKKRQTDALPEFENHPAALRWLIIKMNCTICSSRLLP